jgi:hypothetical protein
MIRRFFFASLLLCFTIPALALPDPLAAALRKCAAMTDQAQRLACFDALVTELPKVEADSFGMTADIVHKRDPVAERHSNDAVLPGKIIALGRTPNGALVFTLDNQQVWLQAEVEPGKLFVVGDLVRIEHGAMGSLWLAADKARKTRVKRIS